MTDSIREGTRYLDTHYPHWEEKIDLDTLDLGDFHACVLGQLHPRGHFQTGLNQAVRRGAPDTWSWSIRHGFLSTEGHYGYKKLTAKWRRAILRRRRANRA